MTYKLHFIRLHVANCLLHPSIPPPPPLLIISFNISNLSVCHMLDHVITPVIGPALWLYTHYDHWPEYENIYLSVPRLKPRPRNTGKPQVTFLLKYIHSVYSTGYMEYTYVNIITRCPCMFDHIQRFTENWTCSTNVPSPKAWHKPRPPVNHCTLT